MAILKIYEFPHPFLRKKARKVKKIDKSIETLVADMIETMSNARGAGLAANQVGVLRRVIAIQLPDEEVPRVYINPEIIHREGERQVMEACLSIPGYTGTITRSIWVKAKGLDQSWKEVRIRAEGLFAQVLEHEVDHLNGILYMDHLKNHEHLDKIQPDHENALVEMGVG